MLVDRRAQVMHDALADDVREPGLSDAENPGHDCDPDQAEDEDREQRVIVLRQRVVEDVADEERRDDAEERREADEPEDGAEPHAVGPEQDEDAAQIRAPHGGIGRPLRRGLRAETRAHGPTLAGRRGPTEVRFRPRTRRRS
jgi:hypothetical protein